MEKCGALNTYNAFARPTLFGTVEFASPVEMDKSSTATVDAAVHPAQFSTAINVSSSQSTNAKAFKTHSGTAINVCVCLAFPLKA